MIKQIICALLLVTIAFCLVNSEVVEWGECDDGQALCQIREVRMNPCSAAPEPCKFKRGKPAGMEFDFVPNFQGTAGNLKSEIFWVSPLGDVEFPGMDTNACSYTNCPLTPNQQHAFNYSIVTSRSYPTKLFNIKVKLTGDDGSSVCCFTTKIKLVR